MKALLSNEPIVWNEDQFEIGAKNQWELDISALELVPSAQRTGKWIDEGLYADYHAHHAWRCSECGEHVIEIDVPWYKFCPYCGARMDADDYVESDYDYVEINPCKGCEDFDGETCTSHGACGDVRMDEE